MQNYRMGGGLEPPTAQDLQIIQQCQGSTDGLAGNLGALLGALDSSINEMRHPAGWQQGNAFNETSETLNSHSLRIRQQMAQLKQQEIAERRRKAMQVNPNDMYQLQLLLNKPAAKPAKKQKAPKQQSARKAPQPEESSLRSRYQTEVASEMPLFEYGKVPAPVSSTGLTEADKEFLTGLFNNVIAKIDDFMAVVNAGIEKLDSRTIEPSCEFVDETTLSVTGGSTIPGDNQGVEYFKFEDDEENDDDKNSGQGS